MEIALPIVWMWVFLILLVFLPLLLTARYAFTINLGDLLFLLGVLMIAGCTIYTLLR